MALNQKKPPPNPWGLTYAQMAAMDAVIEHGNHKLAASALNVAQKTIEVHCQDAGRRMKTRTMLQKYIVYDRWRRGESK
jgi:FixJ family two-component response regulator